MAGYGRDRDCRRNPDEDQKRRHQETAADAEHAGDVADRKPHPQHQEDVHRQVSDGKIDLQAFRPTGWSTSTPRPRNMTTSTETSERQ